MKTVIEMTQDEIIEMAKEAGFLEHLGQMYTNNRYGDCRLELISFAKLIAAKERERIKQANAPEIERVNAHIKKLEDAVLAEREACAKLAAATVCDTHIPTGVKIYGTVVAKAIRARTGEQK